MVRERESYMEMILFPGNPRSNPHGIAAEERFLPQALSGSWSRLRSFMSPQTRIPAAGTLRIRKTFIT